MRRFWCEFWRDKSGQEAVEFALIWGAVVLPLTFALIFVAEMLWVWHSVVDFTREGARYAATHCWQADGANVTAYMEQHVPRMIDMDQFISGAA
ncbi:MAG: pilus assembly protein, partial [Acidobacteria bacterium]|nr:pilus assembly protein [Acidobacteriota bacterium]